MGKRSSLSHLALSGVLALSLGLSACSGSDGAPGAAGQDVDPTVVTDLQQQINEAKAEAEAAKAEAEAAKAAAEGPTLSVAVAHQFDKKRQPFVDATIHSVVVDKSGGTFVDVTFSVDGYTANQIDVEFTIAMSDGAGKWVPMILRERFQDDGRRDDIDNNRTLAGLPVVAGQLNSVRVIRGGNLRYEGAAPLTANPDGTFTTRISGVGSGDYGGWGAAIDFSNGPQWRRANELDVTRYAPEAGDYRDYVQGIMDEINAYTWDDNATYRVGISGRSWSKTEYKRFNAVADFTGAGVLLDNLTESATSISMASCNSCHGDAVYFSGPVHSGYRFDPAICVTCHTPYNYDSVTSEAVAGGWASLDFETMIHKIHNKTQYVANWAVYNTRFPDWTFGRNSGPKNCTACHKGAVPTSGTAWNRGDATIAATCATCHGEGGVEVKASHANWKNCTACHTGAVYDGFPQTADYYHGVSNKLTELATASDYRVRFTNVDTSNPSAPVVTWQVVNAAGTPYDLSAVTVSNMILGIGWGYGEDWTNDGVDPATFADSPRTNGAFGDPWRVIIAAGNTTYAGAEATTTLPALPAEATAGRNGYVAAYPQEVTGAGFNGVAPNTAVATFTLGTSVANADGLPNQRRQIVSAENCNACHNSTFRHGTMANDDIASCVVCHNAGSISRNASAVQGSVDLMFMVHAIHGLADGKRDEFERRYAFASRYDYVTYPSTVLDCNACHVNNSQNLPVDSAKRLGVIADGKRAEYLAGSGVNAPMSSVCFSCHEPSDNVLKNDLKGHMTGMGGGMYGENNHAFWVDRGEGCMACHK